MRMIDADHLRRWILSRVFQTQLSVADVIDQIDREDTIKPQLPSAQPTTNCSEIPNTSDFVSRKAVREMVATWSYDLAEWEDMELALHDVDELPPAQTEIIHCKKRKEQ